MNLLELPGRRRRRAVRRHRLPGAARRPRGGATASTVTVGFRPEDLEHRRRQGEGLQVEVDVVEELGADAYVYGHTTLDGKSHDIVARVDGRRPPMKGETIWVRPQSGHVHLFDTKTGLRLGD